MVLHARCNISNMLIMNELSVAAILISCKCAVISICLWRSEFGNAVGFNTVCGSKNFLIATLSKRH